MQHCIEFDNVRPAGEGLIAFTARFVGTNTAEEFTVQAQPLWDTEHYFYSPDRVGMVDLDTGQGSVSPPWPGASFPWFYRNHWNRKNTLFSLTRDQLQELREQIGCAWAA